MAQYKGAKLFAAINYETGEVTHYEEEKATHWPLNVFWNSF
jgi:hypothetical protein